MSTEKVGKSRTKKISVLTSTAILQADSSMKCAPNWMPNFKSNVELIKKLYSKKVLEGDLKKVHGCF